MSSQTVACVAPAVSAMSCTVSYPDGFLRRLLVSHPRLRGARQTSWVSIHRHRDHPVATTFPGTNEYRGSLLCASLPAAGPFQVSPPRERPYGTLLSLETVAHLRLPIDPRFPTPHCARALAPLPIGDGFPSSGPRDRTLTSGP